MSFGSRITMLMLLSSSGAFGFQPRHPSSAFPKQATGKTQRFAAEEPPRQQGGEFERQMEKAFRASRASPRKNFKRGGTSLERKTATKKKGLQQTLDDFVMSDPSSEKEIPGEEDFSFGWQASAQAEDFVANQFPEDPADLFPPSLNEGGDLFPPFMSEEAKAFAEQTEPTPFEQAPIPIVSNEESAHLISEQVLEAVVPAGDWMQQQLGSIQVADMGAPRQTQRRSIVRRDISFGRRSPISVDYSESETLKAPFAKNKRQNNDASLSFSTSGAKNASASLLRPDSIASGKSMAQWANREFGAAIGAIEKVKLPNAFLLSDDQTGGRWVSMKQRIALADRGDTGRIFKASVF